MSSNKFLELTKDFAFLPGGSDVNPALYGKKNYKSHVNEQSDIREVEMFNNAVKAGKPIIGICKGSQMLGALNGLTLIQDMAHPYNHKITVKDVGGKFDKLMYVNSTHHQCVWTENKLEGDNFEVFGYTSISPYHHYQADEKIKATFEPEIIWYPKVKALGIQSHPELMNAQYDNFLDYLCTLVNKLF